MNTANQISKSANVTNGTINTGNDFNNNKNNNTMETELKKMFNEVLNAQPIKVKQTSNGEYCLKILDFEKVFSLSDFYEVMQKDFFDSDLETFKCAINQINDTGDFDECFMPLYMVDYLNEYKRFFNKYKTA